MPSPSHNMLQEAVSLAADYIRTHSALIPEILIMTGTGLGDSAGSLETCTTLSYAEIPGFPISTVASHAGELVLGHLSGKNVAVMRGRFHLYEGYSPGEIAFPLRVFRSLGVQILILTNAAGGVGPGFNVGDLMLIRDHINLTGENPLIGPNVDVWGPRFPDMSCVYDADLRSLALAVSKDLGFSLREGVYVGLKGPSFETPSEIRFLKSIGAQAVGMSTIMEVIAARHGGMRVLGISTITNINDPDHPEMATLEAVVEAAGKASSRLEQLMTTLIGRL